MRFSGHHLPVQPLPWYAVNDKDPKDQWYTKRDVASRCMKTFRGIVTDCGHTLRGHTFVEPSAGEGCFTDLLPRNSIALDLEPMAPGIERADFLAWTPPPGTYAAVGNPPFGVRGAIALAFVNRAAMFSNWMAFILPMTFESLGKGGARTRVKGANLIHSEELPPASFYDRNGKDRKINTVFQVWSTIAGERVVEPTCSEFVDIKTVCSAPNRRCGMRDLSVYSWFISSTFYANKPPSIVRTFDEVRYGSGYGIIVKRRKRDVARALKAADWLRHSSRATNSCRHIRIQHIRNALVEQGLVDARVAA